MNLHSNLGQIGLSVHTVLVLLVVVVTAWSLAERRGGVPKSYLYQIDLENATPFSASIAGPTQPFSHVWEKCVGSGHALLGLREDWRQHLTQAQNEIGFTYIRFHGLFDDDMSAYLNGEANFFNIDSVFDFLLSINMKPIVELSFMPEALARNSSQTIFHYKGIISPPKDYNQWYGFIQQVVTHLVQRYGIEEVQSWKFEVWNEPNCDFWTGSQQDYFTLYNWTAHAVKSVDVSLLVGGPATCQLGWLPEFHDYCIQHQAPLDFLTSHLYPTDPGLPPTRDAFDSAIANASQFAATVGLPLVMTEFNLGLSTNRADDNFGAAFMGHAALGAQQYANNTEVLSYWTFTDIFEEGGFVSAPFHDGFGLLNVNRVPKPVYRAFQLLRQLGALGVYVNASSPGFGGATSGDVDVIVTVSATTKPYTVSAVAVNYAPFGWNVTAQNVTVSFDNVFGAVPSAFSMALIDSDHVNPETVWKKFNSPTYPSAAEFEAMLSASVVQFESIPYEQTGPQSYTVGLTLQPYSFVFLSFSVN